jgi:hypothetical protein
LNSRWSRATKASASGVSTREVLAGSELAVVEIAVEVMT